MITLLAEKRDILGKKTALLREKGVMPAVLYGGGKETAPISVNLKDFQKVWKEAGESTLIEINLENKKEIVLIYDVAIDPRKNTPAHADFYKVKMDEKIRITIPLKFIGESIAVKNLNGILVKIMHEIEIESLPKDLPHEISVDISRLENFEDQIYVKDLPCPEEVRILASPDDTIALIEEPRSDEKMKAEAEEAAKPDMEKIEVVGRQEKKEEPGEEKEKSQRQ